MKRLLALAALVLALAAACTPSTTDGASVPPAPAQPDLAAATPPSGPAAPNTPDTLSATPAPTPATSSATPAQLANGRAAYMRVCAMCHGPKGEGVTNLGVALTVRDPAVIKEKDTKGQVKDGDKMPPMVGMLQGDELDDVARFVAAGLPSS